MFFKHKLHLFTVLFCLSTIFFHSSCVDTLVSEELVYSNDFTEVDLKNFENGRLFVFQGDTILGFYHNEEVSVSLYDLPAHNLLKLEVEVWIHDSWDGNPDDGINGPDYWYMKIDENEVYRTTFSNSPCNSLFCLMQSYPNEFFRQNNPKTKALQTDLPGLCLFGTTPNYTTRYLVSRMVNHQADSVKITLGDELLQTNSPDPVCDESWSVGKIELTTMVVN